MKHVTTTTTITTTMAENEMQNSSNPNLSHEGIQSHSGDPTSSPPKRCKIFSFEFWKLLLVNLIVFSICNFIVNNFSGFIIISELVIFVSLGIFILLFESYFLRKSEHSILRVCLSVLSIIPILVFKQDLFDFFSLLIKGIENILLVHREMVIPLFLAPLLFSIVVYLYFTSELENRKNDSANIVSWHIRIASSFIMIGISIPTTMFVYFTQDSHKKGKLRLQYKSAIGVEIERIAGQAIAPRYLEIDGKKVPIQELSPVGFEEIIVSGAFPLNANTLLRNFLSQCNRHDRYVRMCDSLILCFVAPAILNPQNKDALFQYAITEIASAQTEITNTIPEIKKVLEISKLEDISAIKDEFFPDI